MGLFFIMVKRTCQFASSQQRSEANRQPRPRHCEQSEAIQSDKEATWRRFMAHRQILG